MLESGLNNFFIFFRSADTEAPDQRTRYLRKKKSKKKKKRKKPGSDPNAANISNESIEEEKTETKEEVGKPITLINCTSSDCEKKFTSESALKYHVTFAHEKKIKRVSKNCGDKNGSNKVAIPDNRANGNEPPVKQNKNSSNLVQSPPMNKEAVANTIAPVPNSVTIKTEKDKEKLKPKVFPSTQNIRPILPAQSPQITGNSALKPIQPKPAILPPPTKNLNLDTLKKPLLNKSSSSNSVSVKSEQSSEKEEVSAIDLSRATTTSPTAKCLTNNGSIAQDGDKKPPIADLNNKALLITTSSSSSIPPSLSSSSSSSSSNTVVTPPKARTPIISVKSEFNTGNKQSLSDSFDKDELEVLKHISKPSSGVSSSTSSSMTPSSYVSPSPIHPAAAALASAGHTPTPASVSEYLSGAAFLSNPLGVPGIPGYMLPPPSSTASHLLPGLMGLPPPPATPLSPFGASLESLARAAEERARSFGGGFSPAHALPSHSPGAAGHGGARPPPGGGGGPQGSTVGPVGVPVPSTSSSPGGVTGEPPLLRHEHMHTHLHYITSPTHQ